MLVFIGLGLYDERDMSLRGLEEARSCDLLFGEFYTSVLEGSSIENLEEYIGKKVQRISREEVEEGGENVILKPAGKKKVGLLVGGDPLISTTHVHLRIEANQRGIKTRIIHNASIFSAGPSISGLHNYKFGRPASIVKPERGYFPESPYNTIKENKRMGLHTLVFLDIKVDSKSTYYMNANEGLKVLLELENRLNEGIIEGGSLCVVLGNVGSYNYVLRAGRIEELVKEDFGPSPHSLIIPGELHFTEEEYLQEFAGLKK